MADVVSREKRSQMMAGIKSINTTPEKIVRSFLHRNGFRFRLYDKKLPGKPDLVLQKYKAVIFVNGCFWHGHNCSLFKLLSSNTDFWDNKIHGNILRDEKIILDLNKLSWRVLTIWECALRGKGRKDIEIVSDSCIEWLANSDWNNDIRGL